jgi:hypothetical protein
MDAQYRGVGWRRGTASDLICDGPCLLYEMYINITVSGHAAILYDAQGPVAGREIKSVYDTANAEMPLLFMPPLRLSQGLYIAVDANVVDYVISYEEIEHDTATYEPHKPEAA